MKQKKQTIFISLILAIFILVTSIYFSTLAAEYQRGKQEAQSTLSLITRETSDALRQNSSDPKALENSFIKCIKNYSSIASITLKSNSRTVFSYPASVENGGLQIPFSLTKTTSLYDGSNGTFALTVTFYLLKPSSIYKKGLIAFCCITAGIILCFIYLSFVTFKKIKDVPEKENKLFEGLSEKEVIEESQKDLDNDFNNIDLSLPVNENENISSENASSENISSSPMTSFKWESQMEERVSVLAKKAEEDQMELSFFIVRIPFINWQHPQVNAMKSLIRETFKNTENIFTYKEDGFAALMPEMNIDKAIYLADALQIAIVAILAKSGLDFSVGIGISSVSSRIVSAERLITEAEQAVFHALEDKSTPVVAFRVSAQKYREFIAASGKN